MILTPFTKGTEPGMEQSTVSILAPTLCISRLQVNQHNVCNFLVCFVSFPFIFRNEVTRKEKNKPKEKWQKVQKHTAPGIRWSSPTQLLLGPSQA
jgi:hypothetical protein